MLAKNIYNKCRLTACGKRNEMKLLDLIKQFGQANYNYGLFNGSDKLQKQYDAERMDLFKQITEQVSVEPEVKVQIASIIQQAVKDWNVTVINPFDKEDADITASIANNQIKQFALYLEQQINESNLSA